MESLERPITTADHLDAAWRELAGPWGFSIARVWVLLIEPEGTLAHIMDVNDEKDDQRPDDVMMANLVRVLTEVMATSVPEGSVAVMRARPGPPATRPLDDAWCAALHRALRSAPFRTWPVYFATDTTVGPASPDALLDRTAG
ncbi:hypothetical protein ASD11_09465 [Aeromicrobium sp. Root495]|uniref:hypothetical protein n=1 Tax=Aeromicrobium sp. Root495 TaxID=1736550 RepID=UPI0006FEDA61|nr:hypothetical protein [Aeromicrobium sp. Root495]KQY59756.1 hypothetical protein ASD11_09465 [Aeromicrobium sp. Root495]